MPKTPVASRIAKRVAIIGGGASGALVCAQLLRSERPEAGPEIGLEIKWIGNESPFGLGLAYGTRELAHLLNVPAIGMSAFPDQPGHFLQWLALHHSELQPEASSFVPRARYGEYLRQLVSPNDGGPSLERIVGEAIDIEGAGSQYRISMKDGGELFADEVVLALGALSSLPGQSAYGALRPSEISAIRPSGAREIPRILLIGTGLTMIDAMLSLEATGHPFEVTAISRRGLLPHAHEAAHPHRPSFELSPEFKAFLAAPISRLSRALGVFRSECRAAEAAGSSWLAVFDGIRPHTAILWSGLTPRQKRRFYRHLRPYWDAHRHRIAPSIHEKLQGFRNQRKLRIEAARILEAAPLKAGYRVLLQSRATLASSARIFDFLVDCTGFTSRITSVNHALLQSVIRRGLVSVDDPPFGISPRVSEHPRVHVIGPLLRASLWETVAIPELRAQAAEIAREILASKPQKTDTG